MTEVRVALLHRGSGMRGDTPLLGQRGVRRILGWTQVPGPMTF